ncbi:MAG: hypothetical protein LUE23_09470, partial [Lachnospiraceae bacterium]|nr:hypothetical protein [Lachnospiraceae bacterium]
MVLYLGQSAQGGEDGKAGQTAAKTGQPSLETAQPAVLSGALVVGSLCLAGFLVLLTFREGFRGSAGQSRASHLGSR